MTPEQVEGCRDGARCGDCSSHRRHDLMDAAIDSAEPPTPEQVEAYGARIITAIDAAEAEADLPSWLRNVKTRCASDRKRVESFVKAYRRNTEGLRQHALAPNGWECSHGGRNDSCPDVARYTAGRNEALQNLKDTGELYGVVYGLD